MTNQAATIPAGLRVLGVGAGTGRYLFLFSQDVLIQFNKA